ncbi:Fic family protein [Xylophilus sp. GW821-FHT01B05]
MRKLKSHKEIWQVMKFFPTTDIALSPIFCLGMAAQNFDISVSESDLLTAFSIGVNLPQLSEIEEIAERIGLGLEECSISDIENHGLYLAQDISDFYLLIDSNKYKTILNPKRGRYSLSDADAKKELKNTAWKIHRTSGQAFKPLPSLPVAFYTIPNNSNYFNENMDGAEILDQSTTNIHKYLEYKFTSKDIQPTPVNALKSYRDLLMEMHRDLFAAGDPRAGEVRQNSTTRNGQKFVHPFFINICLTSYFESFPRAADLAGLDGVKLVATLTPFVADLNLIHPFVNGNGRVIRRFFQQYLRPINVDLDFSKATRSELYHAFFYAAIGNSSALAQLLTRSIRL